PARRRHGARRRERDVVPLVGEGAARLLRDVRLVAVLGPGRKRLDRPRHGRVRNADGDAPAHPRPRGEQGRRLRHHRRPAAEALTLTTRPANAGRMNGPRTPTLFFALVALGTMGTLACGKVKDPTPKGATLFEWDRATARLYDDSAKDQMGGPHPLAAAK